MNIWSPADIGTVAITFILPPSVIRRVLATHEWDNKLNTGNSPIHVSGPPETELHEAVLVMMIPENHDNLDFFRTPCRYLHSGKAVPRNIYHLKQAVFVG